MRTLWILGLWLFCLSNAFPEESLSPTKLREMEARLEAVHGEGQTYFLVDGTLKYLTPEGKVRGTWSWGYKSLVAHAGGVASLSKSGEVSVFDLRRGKNTHWLTSDVAQLFSWRGDLIALKRDGTLAMYSGNPTRSENQTQTVMIGEVPATTVTSVRVSAFDPTGLGQVRSIVLREGEVWVQPQQGPLIKFSELGIAAANREVVYELKFDLENRDIYCTYSNQKEYRVLNLSVTKKKGDLFAIVKYEIDSWRDYISPPSMVPAGRLSSSYPELFQGAGLELETVERILMGLLRSPGRSSWKIQSCRFR